MVHNYKNYMRRLKRRNDSCNDFQIDSNYFLHVLELFNIIFVLMEEIDDEEKLQYSFNCNIPTIKLYDLQYLFKNIPSNLNFLLKLLNELNESTSIVSIYLNISLYQFDLFIF